MSFKIGDRTIGTEYSPLVIAEIGITTKAVLKKQSAWWMMLTQQAVNAPNSNRM